MTRPRAAILAALMMMAVVLQGAARPTPRKVAAPVVAKPRFSWSQSQQDSIYAFQLAVARICPEVTLIHQVERRRLFQVTLDSTWNQILLNALDLESHHPSRRAWRAPCADSLGIPDVIRLRYRDGGGHRAELRYRPVFGSLSVGDSTVWLDLRDRHARFMNALVQALPLDNRLRGVEPCGVATVTSFASPAVRP